MHFSPRRKEDVMQTSKIFIILSLTRIVAVGFVAIQLVVSTKKSTRWCTLVWIRHLGAMDVSSSISIYKCLV